MPPDTNAIGERGEAIFTNIITRRHGGEVSLFRPQFLGDKYPTVGFIVEVIGSVSSRTPIFFVQAKTTTLGYDQRQRLQAGITAAKLELLVSIPAPTYVVGIDEVNERCFIRAALHGKTRGFSRFPTSHDLGERDTLNRLGQEVLDFCEAYGVDFCDSWLRWPQINSKARDNG